MCSVNGGAGWARCRNCAGLVPAYGLGSRLRGNDELLRLARGMTVLRVRFMLKSASRLWQNAGSQGYEDNNIEESRQMVATKRDRKALAFYAAHQHRPPTFGEFVPKLMLYFFIYTALAVVVYALLIDEMPGVVYFFFGMLVGAYLRDLRRFLFTLQLWPFTASITDWQKVEELAEREEISVLAN